MKERAKGAASSTARAAAGASVTSGQVRFTTRPKSRTMRPGAKRKKRSLESQQNERAQISSELESARAMVTNLERFGVDGAGYDETETEPPSSTT